MYLILTVLFFPDPQSVRISISLHGLSSEMDLVSIDKPLLKGEAPRFSANFTFILPCEKPFKFLHHLVQPLGIDNIIAMSERHTAL